MSNVRSSWSVTVVVAMALTSVTSAPASAAPPTCRGIAATIVSSDSTIMGTPVRDVIVVQGETTHTINAGAGNDLICASAGADTINTGAGRDVVFAGDGNDVINGGSGIDILNGGAGADQIHGSTGADRIAGGAGVDALQGGAGIDSLSAGAGANFCASDARDVITGSCTIDAAAPQLMAQPIVASSIVAGSTLTFTWSVADPVGISRTGLKIGGPSGWVTTWCGFAIEGTLVSGTPQDGTYSASCDVPATAVSQEYTAFFDASDVFGSWTQLMDMPFTVAGGTSDSVPPIVSNVQVLPSVVSVGQDFVVRYTVTDPSGVAGAIVWLALNGYGFADNTGRGFAEMPRAPVLVSGDIYDGVWELTVRMSSFAPAGEYTVWSSAIDIPGNKAFEQTQVTFTVVA